MKNFLLVFTIVLLIAPFVVFAQDYTSQDATGIVCNVLTVVKNIVAAVGFGIVVILIIIAGIKYGTAGGDEGKTSEARKGIQNALIGLVIVVSAYFLISLAQGLVTEVSNNMIQLLTDPCGTAVVYDCCDNGGSCPYDQWCNNSCICENF